MTTELLDYEMESLLAPDQAAGTMQAWVIREERHGAPADAMLLEDVAVPEIGPDEVLIEVKAAGVNFNGAWVCRGQPVPLSRLKTGSDFHITGSDASGVVARVGSGVKRWKAGDEVVVHCNVSCGQCPVCNGFDPLACDEQRIWGYETNWGSFAPFAKVQARQLLPKPRHLTWEESASYALCLFTAWRMLATQARVKPGENVLIWGAAGGLGVFAIQICKLFGANPICVVSSEDKEALCRELGAEHVIDRRSFDLSSFAGMRAFGAEIRRLTNGRDPEVVFEHVGKATFPTSVYVCRKFGRIVICGATSGYDLDFDVRYLWLRQKSILGSHFANYYEAEKANQLVIEGKIKPVLRKTFSFDQAPAAQALQEDGDHLGKIAVLVRSPRPGLGRSV
jgi:crotonyl-CoA carboxylase/reductase